MFHPGEFSNVASLSMTLLHPTMESSAGLSESWTFAHASLVSVFMAFSISVLSVLASCMSCVGNHTSPFLFVTPSFSSASHCPAVILPFFTGRHACPLAFIVPRPVMAMSVTLCAVSGDMQRLDLTPSKYVSMSGYCERSAVKTIRAPSSRCSSVWLFISMGPVCHSPAGTISLPPPFSARCAMALRNASVLRVVPSLFPPKSVMHTVYDGICGFSTCAMLNGTPS